MLKCFICHSEVADSVKQLLHHLKTKHALYEEFAKYSCSQGNCCRTFSNRYTFISHIRRQHAESITDHTANETACSDGFNQPTTTDVGITEDQTEDMDYAASN